MKYRIKVWNTLGNPSWVLATGEYYAMTTDVSLAKLFVEFYEADVALKYLNTRSWVRRAIVEKIAGSAVAA